MSGERVASTEWALILADWKRSGASVTIHLRSGVSLGPGKVLRLPGPAFDGAQIGVDRYSSQPEQRWDFDLTEVAAIHVVAQ